MNTQLEMPDEGQFVAVWNYNGEIWSAVYSWINEELYYYDNSDDDYFPVTGEFPYPHLTDVQYIVADKTLN